MATERERRERAVEQARSVLSDPSNADPQAVDAALQLVESLGAEAPPDLVALAEQLSDSGQRVLGRAHPASMLRELETSAGRYPELQTEDGQQALRDLRRMAREGTGLLSPASASVEAFLAGTDVSSGLRSRMRSIIDRSIEMGGAEELRGGTARVEPDGDAEDGPEDGAGAVDAAAMSLEEAIAGIGQGTNRMIGVPEGYTIDRPFDEGLQPGPHEGQWDRTPARYRESHVTEMVRGWPTEAIIELQKKLVGAGLLRTQYRRGFMDEPTRNGFSNLLGFANQRAITAGDAFDALAQERQQERARALDDFRPSLQAAPDPASLRQRAREALISIGRRPDQIKETELAEMTAVMSGEYERQRAVRAAAERQQFERELDREFADPNAPDGGGGPDTFQDVDPAARFNEWFQSKQGYGGEIETRETSAAVARQTGTFTQGLNQMRGMIRQGG